MTISFGRTALGMTLMCCGVLAAEGAVAAASSSAISYLSFSIPVARFADPDILDPVVFDGSDLLFKFVGLPSPFLPSISTSGDGRANMTVSGGGTNGFFVEMSASAVTASNGTASASGTFGGTLTITDLLPELPSGYC